MGEKIIKYLTTASFAVLLGVLVGMGMPQTVEAEDTISISSEEDLWKYADDSQSDNFLGKTFELTQDITLTYNGHGDEFLNFGSSDTPFRGIFDGNGHKIINLNNVKGILPDHDNGLFAWTGDGAVIKNLVLQDPVVTCAYRGGIIVGHAEGTTIENVQIHGGKLKIQPGNNIVSLITNVGFSGGAIAGSIDGSTLYNCEVRGTEVVNNSTQGVAALGGEGLYMGGLVGSATGDSVIEYCRMDDGLQKDDQGKQQMVTSVVRNEYDVAVGALGGKAIYAGGLVGELKGGSQMIDSYSTAEVYAYCATYVSVGAGNVAYVGGVVAEVYGSSCKIERCHYAGNIHSKQYNAVLVIPIIQNDAYVSGVAQYSESEGINNSYFQRSASATTKDIKAINDNADTETCSALSDEVYSDRSFWIEKGYDLTGTIERTEGAKTEAHVNRWVMDYTRGIPIHGNSLSAAIDFPGAGSVTIDGTYLIKNSIEGEVDADQCKVTTDDPYNFAIQGYNTYETNIDLTADITKIDGHENAYRFVGWYLIRDILQDSVSQIKKDYQTLTENYAEGNKVSTETKYTTGSNPSYSLRDNDLYVAHYQAQVAFHDVNGDVIDANTGVTQTGGDVILSDDYYDYQDSIPEVIPTTGPAEDGYQFYGWTDQPDTGGTGYAGITSDQLEGLRAGGHLYQPGELIEKPLNLYPIYTNYLSNVTTIMEGNDKDDSDNTARRDKVALTRVVEENGKVFIQVVGLNESNVAIELATKNEAVFQDGYRFLGWYEIVEEDGVQKEYRVSSSSEYQIPEETLTEKHTYIARLEYKVEYWVKSFSTLVDKYKNGLEYAVFWQEYGSNFQNIAGPGLYQENVNHWGVAPEGEEDGYKEKCSSCEQKCDESTFIYDKLTVYSHNEKGNGAYDVVIFNDFPGAGSPKTNGYNVTLAGFAVEANVNQNYNFVGWTRESYGPTFGYRFKATNKDSKWSHTTMIISEEQLAYGAHYTAKVTFHKYNTDSANSDDLFTVTRRYKENILLSEDHTEIYKYELSGKETGLNSTSAASPTSDFTDLGDKVHFVGWIDKSVLSESEIAHIYDVKGEPSYTSNIANALPYIIDADDIVERPMDIYPVYVKEDITTTTNIKEAGVPDLPDDDDAINIPADPTYKLEQQPDNGLMKITLTADNNTKVRDSEETLYTVQYLECITNPGPDQTVEKIYPDADEGNVFTITDFDLGPSYKLIAYYEPLVVVYHQSDRETEVYTRNTGERLGTAPEPLFEEDKIGEDTGKLYSFVGWTTVEPDDSKLYYLLNDYSGLNSIHIASSTDVVTESLELYPVYAPINVKVSSNIDSRLDSPDAIRYITRADGSFWIHAETNVTGNDENQYVFTGWKVKTTDDGSGTDFSSENEVTLTEVFNGAEYIAQYSKGYTITYHYWDADGTDQTLYTVGVSADSERAGKGFVYTEEDGTDPEKTVTMPYDTEAFIGIMNMLESNQYFDEWEWKKSDGSVVSWNKYKNAKITGNMDLYPKIWQVTVKDAEDAEMSYNTNVYLQADLSSDEPDHEPKVSVYFAGVYSQEKLTVNVSRQDISSNGSYTGIKDVNVDVYNEYRLEEQGPTDEDPNPDPVMTGDYMAGKRTDSNGDAVFEFDGKLVIEKKADGLQADTPFIFTVTKTGTSESQKILVPAGGSTTLKLPFGEYIVTEDSAWAWRYTPSLTVDTHNPDSSGTGDPENTVYINSYSSTATCTNTESNGKWFDFSANNRNVFKQTQGSE